MEDIIKQLQSVIDDPEDLSSLPGIVEKVQAVGVELEQANEKIGKLHGLNRKYLSMIPIADDTEKEEIEQKKTTVDDAVNEIMKGVI